MRDKLLEWQVVEELPPAEEPGFAPLPARRWGRWLLLGLLALLLAGGAALWVARQQAERRLRQPLQAAIEVEARAWAVGAAALAETLADPAAPYGWRVAYARTFDRSHAVPGSPRIRQVTLDDSGTRALLIVEWPPPPGVPSRFEPMQETRAYRLVRGQWLRSPLTLYRRPSEPQRSAHFVLSGPPAVIAPLHEPGGRWQLDLEGLYAFVAASWPHDTLRPADQPLTVEIEPYEFEPLVRPLDTTNTPDIVFANDPTLALPALHVPLAAPSQQRLLLAQAVVVRLLPDYPVGPGLPPTLPEPQRRYFAELALQLRAATARHWALNPDERRALRNHWRAQLGDEWFSPFDGPLATSPSATWPLSRDLEPLADGTAASRRTLALALLLDQLLEAEGPSLLSAFAERLPHLRGDASLATLFAEVTGLDAATLASQARDFALASDR